jgi:hypothetical protein
MILRMPFFRLALTFSWSTCWEKENVLANSPTERSETQYLDPSDSGVSAAAVSAGVVSRSTLDVVDSSLTVAF